MNYLFMGARSTNRRECDRVDYIAKKSDAHSSSMIVLQVDKIYILHYSISASLWLDVQNFYV